MQAWFWLLSRYGWWWCRIPTCSPCSTTSWGTPTTGRSLTGTGDPSPAFYCIIVFNSPPRSWVLLLYCTVVTVRSAAPFRSFRVLQSCLGGSIIYFRWLWVTTDILSYNNTLMRFLKIKYKYVILVKFILKLHIYNAMKYSWLCNMFSDFSVRIRLLAHKIIFLQLILFYIYFIWALGNMNFRKSLSGFTVVNQKGNIIGHCFCNIS